MTLDPSSLKCSDPRRAAVSRADLDSTLWDGNVESFGGARIVGEGEALDGATGRRLRLYPDVASIFSLLVAHGVPIAIASASPAEGVANRMLRGFGLSSSVGHARIAPGKKDVHLKGIAAALGVDLSRALFFDDLPWNIKTAEALGVGGCVLVKGGLQMEDVRKGLRKLREHGRGAAMMRAWMTPAASKSETDADRVKPSTECCAAVDAAAAPSAGGGVGGGVSVGDPEADLGAAHGGGGDTERESPSDPPRSELK